MLGLLDTFIYIIIIDSHKKICGFGVILSTD